MRDLFVVTHPEATHHVERLVGGWYDSDLTPRGREDAQRIAEALALRVPAGESVRLVSSDLRRTRQTAEPIASRLGVELVLDPDLREQSYGVAEGRPAGSVPYLTPPAVGDRMSFANGVAGSETRSQWAGRVYRAVGRLLDAPWRRAVVVTHGGSATYVLAAWIGLPLEAAGYVKIRTTPGGITHLRENVTTHDREVIRLDGVHHLG